MRLTGGQIVARTLVGAGIPWVAGIPGHGCLALVDAFFEQRGTLPLYLVRHEQSAVHLADGYYRAVGRPAAVFTSIGPGALNTAVGLGTAYVDSTAALALIGEVHSHMTGRGVLQELERVRVADSLRVLEPVTKYAQAVGRVEQLPHALNRALRAMLSGRPGPAALSLPMDVQAEVMDIQLPERVGEIPPPPHPDPSALSRAVRLLAGAARPVILAGGGALRARCAPDLVRLAERLGAAVVTTMAGKSAFPEDHPLYAWHAGSKGTTMGNTLTASADVLLAVGCRFADESTSSYRRGISFNLPPTRLVQVDLDPAEIGKNYPVEVGLVGEAGAVLAGLVEGLGPPPTDWRDRPYSAEISRLRERWQAELAAGVDPDLCPVTISRTLAEVRAALPRDGFLVTSSGHTQAQVLQEFPCYEPGTLVTTGGFSTMGFALPAALGVKLAHPDRAVLALVGDGDFLMTAQELATAVQYGLGVVVMVANNDGFLSIRDLQIDVLGPERAYATEFVGAGRQGADPGVHFARLAEAFGVGAERVSRPGEVGPALSRALKAAAATGQPRLVEVLTNRAHPHSGGRAVGWWDVPVPGYLADRRAAYTRAREEESLER